MAKVPSEIALFGPPQDRGGIKLANARRNHGPAQRAPRQAGEHDRIRLVREHEVDVIDLNAPPRQFRAVGRFRHIGFSAEQVRCVDHRLLEGEVLKRMQSIVMDEDADGALYGKQVSRVFNCVEQFLPPEERGMVLALHRGVLIRALCACLATSFNMLTVVLSWE